MPDLIFHHTKYLDVHGVDEGFYDTWQNHSLNHWLLREYHRCEIPIPDLQKISNRAHYRRRAGKPCTIVEPIYCQEFYLWCAWRMFRCFERRNRADREVG